MKAWLIVLIVVVVLGAFALVLSFLQGPDLKAYLPLAQPRINRKPAERVLSVSFSGTEGAAVQKAFGRLFKTYYGLKGAPKGPAMPAPKARFELNLDLSVPAEKRLLDFQKGNWQAEVGIPLPETVSLPEQKPDGSGLSAQIETWEYGEVAEILHRGSYDTEPPTIQKLEDFIKTSGYRAIGEHEEEYLKGPGMPLVFPKDYWTIIRYRVIPEK